MEFLGISGLDKSRPITQQAFFRQCLTAELSSLIDSKITDDLEVFRQMTMAILALLF